MTTAAEQSSRPEGIEAPAAVAIAQRLATVLRTYAGVGEVFTPDVVFDINVPIWRFQVRGPDRFIAWLRGYAPHGYDITVTRTFPTGTGVVVEVEGEYDRHGHHLFFRNLYICEVTAGRISDVSFWCTGDWDEDTRAQYVAEMSDHGRPTSR
jgi:ketosteroid isomerase-like protein